MEGEKCLYHVDHESRIKALEKNDERQNKKLDTIANRISTILGSVIIILLGTAVNLIILLVNAGGTNG
jgi:hypothetical protein